MGIFPNHGIAYYVILSKNANEKDVITFIDGMKFDHNFILHYNKSNMLCVLPVGRVDGRLVKSKYFQERESEWFGIETCRREWIEKIENQSIVDIEITSVENKMLEKVREHFEGYIEDEGWYDVNTIGYSY
jgi:hypothetical protein